MLLIDQTRMLSYTGNSIPTLGFTHAASTSWATLGIAGTISPANPTAIAWNAKLYYSECLRLKIGNYYVFGTYNNTGAPGGTFGGVCFIPSGANQVVQWEFTRNNTGSITEFQLGTFKLKDEYVGGTLGEYSGQFTINIPVRVTPAGTLNTAIVHICTYGTRIWGGTAAECQWANTGDTLIGSVRLNIDSVQQDWTWRNQDTLGTHAASAFWEGTITCGANHTVDLTKGTETMVHISVYASPWLIGVGTHTPVDLNFPQKSTFYTVIEPLCTVGSINAVPNVSGTRSLRIGKVRAVSFGTANDYYYTMAGTGITTATYTYENIDPASTGWHVTGFGGCISAIGVDIR